jgi:ABC-2 type transport system permease protein
MKMKKVLVIAKREFTQRVRSKAFLFGAIGTPLILLVVWFFTGNIGATPPEAEGPDPAVEGELQGRVGYVDRSGLIQAVPEDLPEDRFKPYPYRTAAEIGLQDGEVEAFYVIPEDYRQSGEIQRVSLRLPTSPPETEPFEQLLIRNLFPERDPDRLARLRSPFRGNEPIYRSLPGEQDPGGGGSGLNIMPFIVTMFVLIPLFTGGGYLLQSLGKEKGEKVMEVLLVTVRPRQLLTGKLLGLGLLVIVQYAIWLLVGGTALAVLSGNPLGALPGLQLSGGDLAVILPFALGGFCLYAALMGGIGALAPDLEGGRSWTFLITLPMMIPLYFWAAITGNPQGTLALILSIFPFSAPVAMLLRLTSAAVPPWQIAASLGLLTLAVLGTMLLMARLFRAQTLLSGEPLSLKRFWSALITG